MFYKLKSSLLRLIRKKHNQPINTPLEAIKIDELDIYKLTRPVYVEMPIDSLRGFMELGAPMRLGKGNPFVETAKVLIDDPATPDELTPLAAFYRDFQPRNAAEFLGLRNTNSNLSKISPWQAQLPWDSTPSFDIETYRKNAMKDQAEQYNLKLSWTDGYNCFGPVSSEKLNFEIRRLKAIIVSIQSQGFVNYNDNDAISARLMLSREKVIGLLREGNHRVSVLTALGFNAIPLLVQPNIITLNSPHFDWQGLRHNFFSEAEAMQIFRRIENGDLPYRRYK